MFCILTDFFQTVEKHHAACFMYSFKHTKATMPNKCFLVSFLFYLLLKVIICRKQNIILVCFSEMDANVRKNVLSFMLSFGSSW